MSTSMEIYKRHMTNPIFKLSRFVFEMNKMNVFEHRCADYILQDLTLRRII